MKVIKLDLPLPPSANTIWKQNRKTGRIYLNPRYTAWKKAALQCMWPQKPVGGFPHFPGAFAVHMTLPLKLRPDPDNLWKPLLDFLQKPAGIIANDKHSKASSQSRSADIPSGHLRVWVYETKEAA